MAYISKNIDKDQTNQMKSNFKEEKKKNQNLEIRIRDLELELTRLVQEHHK